MPPREVTNMPIERPFTASQARNQRLTSLEPIEESGKRVVEDAVSEPLEPLTAHLEPTGDQVPAPPGEVSSQDLQAVLLALAKQVGNRSQKKLRVIKEPDPFSGGGLEELHAFIFQCQIYFRVCEGEFTSDVDKVFFAISYLRGIALDYFKPFINKPNPYHNLDFLENWSAFVQKLSNIFGSYFPEDDDEDAIVSIPFPNDGKAIDYFIRFAKYQNHICWDKRALQKVVKDAIPTRIRDELRYSQEDMSSFKGFKRAVLQIDNDHWKRIQDDKNKSKTNRFPSYHTPKPPRPEWARTPGTEDKPGPTERLARPPPSLGTSSISPTQKSPSSNILGADGWLTPVERQCHMNLGLCLHCSQSGHLARTCP